MMPLYANPGSPKERIPSIRQFYADDSECVIAGRKHALLGALELRDPNFVLGRFLKLQRGLRLGPFEEIKWNSSFPPQHRIFITDALLPIFNGCTGFLVIHYNGKQSAAIELCRQLSDYCRSMECDGFGITLDENIVHDARDFDQKISGIVPGPVAWSAVDSKHNPLIQLADLFVGINKRRIDFGTGHADPNKVIEVEFYEGQKSQLDLSYYFFAGLRYSLWGKVRGLCCDSTRPDHSDPFKHNLGYGLRIFSPLPRGEKLAAVSQFGKEFMGCIH
jgi:hypothetical protein